MNTDTLTFFIKTTFIMIKKILFCVALLACLTSAHAATPVTVTETQQVTAMPADGESIDFTLNDINGKSFSLSSLKGKYVIVDFWGSWCINCIKGFPKMKEYYAAHKDKLEIVSVDCNDTDARWKAAVAKHALPWLNVYNARGAGDITKKLGVAAFPTKIAIDPEGKVIGIFVGETDDIYTALDKAMAQ